MIEKKYRVNDWFKFSYSEIGEYIDENHTDKPLRNDEIVDLLNKQHEQIQELQIQLNCTSDQRDEFFRGARQNANRVGKLVKENEKLKEQLNEIILKWTQNQVEFNKDKLYVKDNNTEIVLENGNLFISVFIPKIKEMFRFNYMVTGRKLKKEYNTLKGDDND